MIKVGSAKQLLGNEPHDADLLDEKAELCLIAFIAYFEAFCKAMFAAVINVCPQVLNRFANKSRRCELDVREILIIRDQIHYRLGSLVSEKYDFGSAKNINSLFLDLLKITPFSKIDGNTYSQLLNDRNLLVHHGGVYTYKYAGQKFTRRRAGRLAAWDSLVVTKDDAKTAATFLADVARKMATSCTKALFDFIETEGIELDPERMEAIVSMGTATFVADQSSVEKKKTLYSSSP